MEIRRVIEFRDPSSHASFVLVNGSGPIAATSGRTSGKTHNGCAWTLFQTTAACAKGEISERRYQRKSEVGVSPQGPFLSLLFQS